MAHGARVNNFDDPVAAVRECAGSRVTAPRLPSHIDDRATVERVRDLLEGVGFTIMNIVQCSDEMRLLSGTALINHHFIKLGFLDGWRW